jgi:hypothetical protein
MPATISIGNPASGMHIIVSGDLAPDHEQGDIVASWLAADEGSHHRGTGCPGNCAVAARQSRAKPSSISSPGRSTSPSSKRSRAPGGIGWR